MLSEAELLQIYREHTGPLYAFVSRRVGGDRTLAEDIVQDAWLRAVESWPRRGTPDHPRAWLIRVARNLLVSHFRRQRPTPVDPAELELEADDYRPETPWAAALVSWGLARLRRGQAALLEASYFDGKSTREIADELGLSERAVEGRLRRARQNLEKRLRPYVGAEAPAGLAAEPTVEPVTALELSEGGRKNA
ncbi:MAG: sigma-70 family RNA polymerase sigma factor [Gemmatimonadota bacterium]|nr:MAG: sigma-70 family RNA polymerase sigma factor [Gemmatimonadota bacterium]